MEKLKNTLSNIWAGIQITLWCLFALAIMIAVLSGLYRLINAPLEYMESQTKINNEKLNQ